MEVLGILESIRIFKRMPEFFMSELFLKTYEFESTKWDWSREGLGWYLELPEAICIICPKGLVLLPEGIVSFARTNFTGGFRFNELNVTAGAGKGWEPAVHSFLVRTDSLIQGTIAILSLFFYLFFFLYILWWTYIWFETSKLRHGIWH